VRPACLLSPITDAVVAGAVSPAAMIAEIGEAAYRFSRRDVPLVISLAYCFSDDKL